MSYEEFRRRIDTARQILVGAVPSPAGQIDQITYALMYKFMNDIDDKSASLGGKRSYFTGEYAQYNWHNLMSASLGAQERLELYRQAIQTMTKNPALPPMFREIYQNAFLPFNSANVLTLFLKEIDKFNHGESDDIGDAYEYLLSITGAQGDVGQFRTPRHIIKFIVEVVNPRKTDTVLDPACGTAGFLISAYSHVRAQHDGVDAEGKPNDEKRLSADELDKIHHNYRGFDIDPTMVRTAKVNLYLHGFKTPEIINHDSLSSEDYWNERYDVILANPPFMTPKGGIQPHKKFSISANRAEVLFVDYIASHLKPTGRAGIVVPEGIIFQSGKAYKELRKNLVENYLYAVVSLPAGVFQPYSGVKTSVLLLDKELAKQRDKILFIKIEKDGFSLGAQRAKLCEDSGNHPNLCPQHSDLPHALHDLAAFKAGQEFASELAHSVLRSKIAESGDYNLSGDRYKIVTNSNLDVEFIELGEVAEVYQPKTITSKEVKDEGEYKVFGANGVIGYYSQYNHEHAEVAVTCRGATCGTVNYTEPKSWITGNAMVISPKNSNNLNKRFLYYILQNDSIKNVISGSAQPQITRSSLAPFKIPLPPIEIQREIVAELDGYQKIIDAAQTIVQTYKPTIKINPEWDMRLIGEIAEVRKGSAVTKAQINPGGSVPVVAGGQKPAYYHNVSNREPDVITISASGAYAGFVNYWTEPIFASDCSTIQAIDDKRALNRYIFESLKSLQGDIYKLQMGGGQPHVYPKDIVKISIPLPPIEIQREIVAELEAEQKLIDANKKLIEIYQQKIKSKIAEVWGES